MKKNITLVFAVLVLTVWSCVQDPNQSNVDTVNPDFKVASASEAAGVRVPPKLRPAP